MTGSGAMDAQEKRISLRVATLQFGAVVSWTMYVLFLPGLLDLAGIARHWLIWILILDQAVFAVSDWVAGERADRVTGSMRRLGRSLALVALLSSIAMASLPWVAGLGQPALLVGVVVFWVATSSALRAPAFSLLSKVGGIRSRSGAVSLALLGLSLASATAPLFTHWLRDANPRLPMLLAAAALAIAAWLLARQPVMVTSDDGPFGPSRSWVPLVLAAFAAALATQLHNTLVADAVAPRFPSLSPDWLRSTFWIGFTVGLAVAARMARPPRPLRTVHAALLIGATMLVLVRLADSVITLSLAQFLAGIAWGVILTAMVVSALSKESSMYAGAYVGMLFSALALAAMTRLLIVAAGLQKSECMSWLPAVLWLAAGLLLSWPLLRRMVASAPTPHATH